MNEDLVNDVLDAVVGVAVDLLDNDDHAAFLHLIKELITQGVAGLAVTRLTAKTGDLVREDCG